MRRGKGGAGVGLLLSFSLLGSSLAGTLGNFEDAVAKPKASSSHSDDSHDDSLFNDLFGGCFTTIMEGTVKGIFLGGKWLVYDWWARPVEISYEAKATEVEAPYTSSDIVIADVPAEDRFSESHYLDDDDSYVDDGLKHIAGTAGLPYLRFDYRRQYVDSDLDANDFLLEAGYKYAALYARFTRYEDHANKEDLDIEQYYGLFRLGGSDEFFFPGAFQVGLGAGGYVIKGVREQSGAALTVPILVYPSDYFGIEFRPAWASINEKVVSDYDISVSAGQRFIQLRAGYRWLWVQGEGHWLNGPYAGVSLSF